MKLKVCGLKYPDNILSVAKLPPDYMGFIFFEGSKRNFEGIIPELPSSIKKTGVFVNEHIEIVVSLAQEYQLDALQLHGEESPVYIENLKKHLSNIEIIKVLGVKDRIDHVLLKSYEENIDYFLFDTKGKERGGNGVKFDWSVLQGYPLDKPFFLSGGIGLEDVEAIKEIMNSGLPVVAVDVNSKFETAPGIKNTEDLTLFKNKLASI